MSKLVMFEVPAREQVARKRDVRGWTRLVKFEQVAQDYITEKKTSLFPEHFLTFGMYINKVKRRGYRIV